MPNKKPNGAPSSGKKLRGVIGLADLERPVGDLSMSLNRMYDLTLPEKFTPGHIQRMQKDAEGFARILREHPQEVQAIFDAISRNEIPDAVTMARKIGLTEEDFSAQGGGIVWLAVGAVFLAVLLFTSTIHEAYGAAADEMIKPTGAA